MSTVRGTSKAHEGSASLTEEQSRTLRDLQELDRGRASFYRTLSSLFFKEVTQEQIEAISRQDLSGLSGGVALIDEGYADIAQSLHRIDSGTRQKLACDYARVFLSAGNYDERVAPPYESVFTSADGLLMQDARDEVYQAFLAEHLSPEETLHIPEDHLSFELEFMAHLIDRCDAALDGGNLDEALRLAVLERDFNHDHLQDWIDPFCDAVCTVALTGFYRGIAKVTRGFVYEDAQTIADIVSFIEALATGARTPASVSADAKAAVREAVCPSVDGD